ncbi:helix-turn-helix transcriptional regulator [Pragia fontium]|uniref:AraC-type DNA-binding protein n=1 Tax=Pragia fontium DSM 5563 = ATCC 49100 TaxID=1122977 RepID=A0AAJ5BHZ9_9GAMM|nr:helix-turn-helix transcriptional regulator [Pragia fontium]SFD16520.1 AraC-type DNA-binding protein [Pragia fontium DSM 5563 = ATCC 49100]SUB80979.1 Colonization factor antigen I subunit D [Pragia fontium]VEJ52809.1 Colonization factor antigen I subunit D [Pragia fontium]
MNNIYSLYQARKPQVLRQLLVSSPLLVWVQRGQKRIITENSDYRCHQGECLVLPAPYQFGVENMPLAQGPYSAHCIVVPEAWTIRFLQQYGSQLPSHHQQHPVFSPSDTLSQQLENFIHLIKTAEISELAMTRAEHAWQQVLLTMAFEHVGQTLYTHPENSLANTIRTLIQADLGHSWQLEQLAKNLNMSESTLRRKLHKEHTSFTQILHDMRMSYAAHLLMTSADNIQQIALNIGYSSPSKFASRFEKQFGTTPSELRKTR